MQFAPTNLFCAHAVAANGDPDLLDGIHLRILAAAELGPPLGPYAIWPSQGGPKGIAVRGPRGPLTVPSLQSGTRRIVGVEASAGSGPQTVVIRDSGGFELARKSAVPLKLAAPMIQSVELASEGAVTLIPAQASDFSKIGMAKPILLGMPIEGECAWYAGGVAKEVALKRVFAGAPRRLSALDRPKGPYSLIPPEAEVARVVADQAGIDDLIEALVRNGDTPPAKRSRSLDDAAPGGDPDQGGEQPIAEALLFSTVDYGFARYAGSAVSFPLSENGQTVQPQTSNFFKPRPTFYWVVGLFAVAKDVLTLEIDLPGLKFPILSGLLPTKLAADERALVERMIKLTPGLEAVVKRAEQAGLVIRPMLTVALAFPPADYLAAPVTQRGAAAWIAPAGGPSTRFRQNFRFPQLPFAATMAMSSSTGGKPFAPRAERVTTAASAPATIRHNVILVGRDEHGVVIASDAPVDAAQPVTYRFAFADLFGRYGKSRQIAVSAPPRPGPPAPQPQPSPVRAELPPGSVEDLSPGKLSVAVPVPAVTALGPGARPIEKLEIAFAGDSRELVTSGGDIVVEFALPVLAPQASGNWPLTATFVDDDGTVSSTATLAIAITDARTPSPIKAAPGIIWTSRPGPATEVELNLSWPSNGASAFRAYLADARGIGLTPAENRAETAFAGCELQRQHQLPPDVRSRFRLLTDPPVPAGGDTTSHAVTLPRALTGVSFLKLIPLTAEGVEADFDACDFVPIAVPTDHRPPPPRLTGTVSNDGKSVALTVSATGLDLVALHAAEPGLFGAPLPGTAPPRLPEFRLRRASGMVTDPLYARLLRVGELAVEGGEPTATVIDTREGGLPPFVRCTWWAEVRMPPERRLPVDVLEMAPGGLQASFDAQKADMPAPYSTLSAPFTTIPAPATAPLAVLPEAVTVTVANATKLNLPLDDRTVTVSLANPPRTLPEAIGPYHLTIWIEWTDRAPELVADVPITATPFSWDHTFKVTPVAVTVTVAVVDPFGRSSTPTKKMLLPA